MPIRWAASCDTADRRTVATLWPTLRHAMGSGGTRSDTVDLTVAGGRAPGAQRSAVGLVAVAAAGWAAGHHGEAVQLLGRADAMNRAHPTYYSSAWVALGAMMLESSRLGTCGGT
jgi:endoglucanase